jgi:hypothetical protein
LFGENVCSDEHYGVVEEAEYDPAELLPSTPNSQAVVAAISSDADDTAQESHSAQCEVPRFNGQGDFEEWVAGVEDTHRACSRVGDLSPRLLYTLLDGVALDEFLELMPVETETWGTCVEALSRQLRGRLPKDAGGVEVTTGVDTSHTPPTIRASPLEGEESDELLHKLRGFVRGSPSGLEIWTALRRKVKEDRRLREVDGAAHGGPQSA